MPSITIMVWGYTVVRGYSLIKKQEVIKATLPLVRSMNVWITELMSSFTYGGDTWKKVFKQCVMAVLNYWTDTGIVKPLQIIVKMQGENLAIFLVTCYG